MVIIPRYLIGFLNLAHALDHLFMLIFPTAVLGMTAAFGRPYGDLLPLALGGFVAFGVGALPVGWLGDRWSRYKMMAVFFFGAGLASIAVGLVTSAAQLAAALTVLGAFAAIYHPIASAMLVADPARVGRVLGVNGLFGNLGIAGATLTAGALTDLISWRAAFIVPGLVAVAAGAAFLTLVRDPGTLPRQAGPAPVAVDRAVMLRVFLILVVALACGGVVFQATTIAMPKLFEERLAAMVTTPLGVGVLVALVYTVAAFAQLCVGPLIDRLALRSVFLPVVALQVPLLAAAGMSEGWPLLIAALAMMLVVFGQIPLYDATVARFTADAYRARAYAARYLLSFGTSAVAVPLVALLHRLTGGFREIFTVLAGLALCSLLALLAFPRFGRSPAG